MSGAGKWIKKHPLQTVGLLAGAAVGGPALAGLFGAAEGAAVPIGAGALGGAAEGGGGAFAGLSGASQMPVAGGGFAGAMDKMAPYTKLAGQMQGLLSPDQSQPQAPQIAPPQLRGPGQTFNPAPLYGSAPVDPEEERRRMMLAMLMGQQSGVA